MTSSTTDVDPATSTPYRPSPPDARHGRRTAEELRARIPGWGVDLDPADRPSFPRERFDPDAEGPPPQQPESRPRERSIEHSRLTPAFGTAQPLHGLSGRIRRLSYRRFSEGRAAHWLLLVAADRVDVVESAATALLRGRPDDPVAETGVLAERHGGLRSRRRSSRSDPRHHLLDPLVVAGPWVLGGYGAYRLGRRIAGAVPTGPRRR